MTEQRARIIPPMWFQSCLCAPLSAPTLGPVSRELHSAILDSVLFFIASMYATPNGDGGREGEGRKARAVIPAISSRFATRASG
jgi:hypothetical protein